MKKKKPKEPTIPFERSETVRQDIIAQIEGRGLTAKEISAAVRISEREVYEHLEHIRRTLTKKEEALSIAPAECVKCGFVFRKRERLTKPGRCPVCRGEHIHDPVFSIAKGTRSPQPRP